MRILLFCENKYAIDIVQPLYDVAMTRAGYEVMWYVHAPKIPDFPLKDSVRWTSSMQEACDWKPEAVFAPGNIVPYYMSGVKCSIFHGYAAEKRDQFHIRNYFDIYMTSGRFFTDEFLKLQKRYRDFEVVETGWTRQDWIVAHWHDFDDERRQLLEAHGCSRLALYAPTFSPRWTSLHVMEEPLRRLVSDRSVLLIVKLHALTPVELADKYRRLAEENENIFFKDDYAISKYMLMSDIMISDTSSTIYEMLLMDKPVITLNTASKTPYWKNISNPAELIAAYDETLDSHELDAQRQWVIDNYDPYRDGRCAERMLDAAEDYIRRNGVPTHRRLNLWRKYMSVKTFGRVKRN